MKKIAFIIITLILFVISCSKDYLEISPYDNKVISNFYKTPKDALEALVAAYDPIRWNYFNHVILMTEASSDNCFAGGGKTDDDRIQVWDNFDGSLYSNPHDDPWEKYYTGIYRVNVLIENIDKVDWGNTPELKNRYEAEARFLRAYYYLDLVRIWGHIPLLKTVLTVDNLNVPQAEPEDVYKFIAEDLKFSIENLEPIPFSRIPSNEKGRVTKWAAEALMARAFLFYTGYYNLPDLAGVITKDNVRSYIDDVVNNSGHNLVEKYENLWVQSTDKFAGEDNIETVFGIKYSSDGMGVDQERIYGNQWQVMIAPRMRGYNTYAQGWGCLPVNPRLWHEWPAGDTRRNATIISWADEGIVFDASDQKENTGFNWKKFVPLAVDGNAVITAAGGSYIYDNPDDKPEIRYADILLMGAELHLDDDLALAQQYFNKVRNRAYDGNAPLVTLTNDENGLNAIMDERKYEFALEGQRYWDLLRRGLDVAKQAIDWNESDPYYDLVNKEYAEPIVFRMETGGFYSIPPTQIELSNGFLVQNEGWD